MEQNRTVDDSNMRTHYFSASFEAHSNWNNEHSLARRPSTCWALALLLLALCAPAAASAAVHLQTLKVFGQSDSSGVEPYGRLIQGADGAIYGTAPFIWTQQGFEHGVVFRIATNGTGYLPVHRFNYNYGEGTCPYGGLLQATEGALYGGTYDAAYSLLQVPYGVVGWAAGTVYKLNQDGSGFVTLHRFNTNGAEGIAPYRELIQGTDGLLYGATFGGGSNNAGTVFRIGTDGSAFSVLHSFQTNGVDGQNPSSALLQAGDGLLYGSTVYGGSNNAGTVFKLGGDGSGFTVVHSFSGGGTDGANPFAGLIQGSDGALYGTTRSGMNGGVIFKVMPDGSSYQILHSFSPASSDGSQPYGGLLLGRDGALYGTTRQGGTGSPGQGVVFRIQQDGSGYQILHDFNLAASDGGYSVAGLLQDREGALYGTTANGGSNNVGTIFRMEPNGNNYSVLWNFVPAGGDGSNALALVEGTNGVLYGASSDSGRTVSNFNSTIFSINKDGSGYKVLYNLPYHDYSYFWVYPSTTLLYGRDGALYGLTAGPKRTNGTEEVFTLNSDGSGYRVLYQVSTNSGTQPKVGVLLQGTDGALYGTTDQGGSYHLGTVFKLSTDGSGYAVLHYSGSITDDGAHPAALVEADDGMLYGTTRMGGTLGYGTVYTVGKDGSGYRVLYNFTTNVFVNTNFPTRDLIQASDGALYGTLQGAIFTIRTDGSQYGIVHSFAVSSQNPATSAGLFEGSDGALYCAMLVSPPLGLIFRVNKDGSGYSEIWRPTSALPVYTNGYAFGSLLKSADGSFYGTTCLGGLAWIGTVFRMWPPQTPDLMGVQRGSAGAGLTFAGQAGSKYQVLRSTDLKNWSVLNTITMPESGTYTNMDDAAPPGAAYYRAAWVP